MSDFVQCLRLDAQFRTAGSGSDFEVELADNLSTTPGTMCHVSGVSFPVTGWTIEQSQNDRLYLRAGLLNAITNIYDDNDYIVSLEPGQWDGPAFATMLQTAIRNLGSGMIDFFVTYDPSENRFRMYWDTQVTPRRRWKLFSDSQLASLTDWHGYAYDRTAPQSCQNVIRLEESPGYVFDANVYDTGFFDFQADWHILYVHSNLSTFQSSGPRMADRDVIARAPVTSGYGYMNHWQPQASPLWFPVPSVQLKNLRFRLTNAKGETVNLHGGNMAIELYFSDNAS